MALPVYYAPPPGQPPNAAAAFIQNYLAQKNPWAMALFRARLAASDPTTREKLLLQAEALDNERARIAAEKLRVKEQTATTREAAWLRFAADIDATDARRDIARTDAIQNRLSRAQDLPQSALDILEQIGDNADLLSSAVASGDAGAREQALRALENNFNEISTKLNVTNDQRNFALNSGTSVLRRIVGTPGLKLLEDRIHIPTATPPREEIPDPGSSTIKGALAGLPAFAQRDIEQGMGSTSRTVETTTTRPQAEPETPEEPPTEDELDALIAPDEPATPGERAGGEQAGSVTQRLLDARATEKGLGDHDEPLISKPSKRAQRNFDIISQAMEDPEFAVTLQEGLSTQLKSGEFRQTPRGVREALGAARGQEEADRARPRVSAGEATDDEDIIGLVETEAEREARRADKGAKRAERQLGRANKRLDRKPSAETFEGVSKAQEEAEEAADEAAAAHIQFKRPPRGRRGPKGGVRSFTGPSTQMGPTVPMSKVDEDEEIDELIPEPRRSALQAGGDLDAAEEAVRTGIAKDKALEKYGDLEAVEEAREGRRSRMRALAAGGDLDAALGLGKKKDDEDDEDDEEE